jgi:hypothetical protein
MKISEWIVILFALVLPVFELFILFKLAKKVVELENAKTVVKILLIFGIILLIPILGFIHFAIMYVARGGH